MTEFLATLRDALAALAAADPKLQRFGARQHRYQLAPPIELALEVPDDYRAYVTRVSAGGVGPYYGLLRPDRSEPEGGMLPIAHMGCGYAALLVLEGPARGQVWMRAQERSFAIHPSFTAFMLDWIDRVTHGRWLAGFVQPGTCALAAALSGYLDHCEQRRGLAPGTLAGEALREDLAALGPGAIQLAGEPPLFDDDDPVDPCVTCAQLLESLGLPQEVVVAGVPPRAAR